MTPLILDTHAAVNELVSAGMPERQAETVVRQQAKLLEQNLATKTDIEAIKAEIEALRQETGIDQGRHRSLAAGNQGPHRSREGGSHQVDLWPQPRDGESDRRPHQAVVTTGRPAGLRTSVLTFCPTSAPSRAVFLLLSVIPDPDRGSSAFSFSFVRKATDTGFSITIVEDDRKGT